MTASAEPSWLPSLGSVVEEMTGRPLADLTWPELVTARDQIDGVLNAALNLRQCGQ